MSMEAIQAKLKEQKIDFIVGPLIKQNIEKLNALDLDIPTLALNSSAVDNSILYTFTLSPEDEAKQAAQMIASQSHKNPLVIAPKTAYGKRVAAAFTQQWLLDHPDQTPQDVESFYFTTKSKFAHFIDVVMKTNESKQRIHQMQAMIGARFESEARSRRDVDAIYIVSKRNELILFKPYLAVATSKFAEPVPLYASSRSHGQDRNDKQRKELAPLIFSENNFLLDPDNKVSKETKKLWARQPYKTQRLFAFGHDSYTLIGQLMQLQHVKAASYKGFMGEFSLDDKNNIQSQYGWAQYTAEGDTIEVATPDAEQIDEPKQPAAEAE